MFKKIKNENVKQLSRFYKGRNILKFYRLWEKAITLLLINKKYGEIQKFYNNIKNTILKTRISNSNFNSLNLTEIFHDNSEEYLLISLCIPLALLQKRTSKFIKRRHWEKIFQEITTFGFGELPSKLRQSNLVNHGYVAWPLINFTNYDGDLTYFDKNILFKLRNLKLDNKKIEYSPRFIHLDEFQTYKLLESLINLENSNKKYSFSPKRKVNLIFDSQELLKSYREQFYPQKSGKSEIEESIVFQEPCLFEDANAFLREVKIGDSTDSESKSFRVGIANIKVLLDDIKQSYKNPLKTNLSYERQAILFDLINEGLKKPACDILIFPEVSIPFSWFPFFVEQARKKQIGMVFGLEHIIVQNNILNFVATILPSRTDKKYKFCLVSLRLKNHFSPAEEKDFARLRYEIPNSDKFYEIFDWKKATFSVFNCFELTNIKHRSILRTKIELLIAVEWNRDVNYFSNIIESASRDLNCYVVQVNTSDLGDSRITAPYSSKEMNIVRIKGGDNYVLVKAALDLEGLRKYLRKGINLDNRFKPLPAGFSDDLGLQMNNIK